MQSASAATAAGRGTEQVMPFSTIDQIRDSFNISAHDHDEIRRELRRRLKEVHPDRQPADAPADEHTRGAALRIIEALNVLDDLRRSPAVIPVSEVNRLVQAMHELTPEKRIQTLEAKLTEHIAARSAGAQHQGRPVKYALLALSAVLTLIWLFPGLATSHPVLGGIISITSPAFTAAWLAVLVLTAGVWLVLHLWGQRETASKRALQLELEHNRLFNDFIRSQLRYRPGSGKIVFYKDQLVLFLQTLQPPWTAAALCTGRPRPIDPELAETVAAVILERLSLRGIIRRDSGPALRERYTLSDSPDALSG